MRPIRACLRDAARRRCRHRLHARSLRQGRSGQVHALLVRLGQRAVRRADRSSSPNTRPALLASARYEDHPTRPARQSSGRARARRRDAPRAAHAAAQPPRPTCSSAPAATAIPIPARRCRSGWSSSAPTPTSSAGMTCSGYHHGDGSIMGLQPHASVGHRDRRHARRAGRADARRRCKLLPGALDKPDAGLSPALYATKSPSPAITASRSAIGVRAELTVDRARPAGIATASPPAPGHLLVDLAHLSATAAPTRAR